MKPPSRAMSAAWIAVCAIVLSQCSQSPQSPTSPGAVAPTAANANAVGDTTTSTPTATLTKLCKEGNVDGTFNIAVVANGPTVVTSPYTVPTGQCRVIAENTTTAAAQISVDETSAGFVSASYVCLDGIVNPLADGGAVPLFNQFHGCTVTYVNNVVEEPPGDEGCTPGYWKQAEHLDSWPAAYSPSADFDATFGVNFFNPNITLLQAAAREEGGVNALARHGVAALLNAASTAVDYVYTLAEVFDIVQGDGAYAGLTVEQRKNLLDTANRSGCPLN